MKIMQEHISVEIITQLLYGLIAVCGGVARYLNSYANGQPFKLSILAASAFVAGFGGWVFALLGVTMDMPQNLLWVMAGVGGFFSEQSLKFAFEYFSRKVV